MVMVLLIQAILFGIAIFGGNTVASVTDEYLNILDNRVLVRKNDLQEEMLQRWSNITDFEAYIQKAFKESGRADNLGLTHKLLKNMADQVVFYLRQRGVTEIFVILEGDKGHEGIYLRDLDPFFNSNDNSDILMERGSMDIAQKIGVPLDSKWAYKFDLSEQDEGSNFYYKPYNAAKEYPYKELQDLGYWSRPFSLSQDDIEIITYSLPLIDDNGEPYGVMGVGLTVDYLSRRLKYDELADNKRGFYTLNIYDRVTSIHETAVTSGPMYHIFAKSKTLSYEKLNNKNIYKIKKSHKIDGDIYASNHPFVLYNKDTPFEQEEWSLTGFVEKDHLFSPIRGIIISIMGYLTLSLGVGLVVIYISGTIFMKPIDLLITSVMGSNPNTPLKLAKTNIPEIDKLGLAIESLNNQVLASASKLSQIINMVNIPIGAFEYTDKEDEAFCTNTFFELLGIKIDPSVNYVKKSYLIEILGWIKKHPESDIPNVYYYQKEDGKNSWIELIIQEQEGKVLGVIEDVTEDIIAKRKMEYERDHDILTHLLNRRAFTSIVKKKMKEKILGYSALVMWDLDNLKYVNDAYGHEYGDRYIQKAAEVLKTFMIHNVVIARMSGDEFFIFIYDYKDKDNIRKIVNDMKESLYRAHLQVPGKEEIRIRASGGLSWYPDDATTYEELMKYTDFAMYEIKNREKGSIGEFNIGIYNKDSILLSGKEELNFFIDNAMVKYAFQPIVCSKTAEIFAYEALMRPQTKRLQSPYDVVRLAQSQSKLHEIEKLTFFKAMETYVALKSHFKDKKIFINSIPNHALSKEDIEKFESQFARHLHKIVIEITENEQSNEESTQFKQLKADQWGSYLALDDFGSGYNSELSLLILSPKYVKVDMNIIRGVDQDINRKKLLTNIVSYCKNRDIKVIAEGIETKEEMDTVINFGVDYMQGYYLGKPDLVPQDISLQVKREIRA